MQSIKRQQVTEDELLDEELMRRIEEDQERQRNLLMKKTGIFATTCTEEVRITD